MVEIESRPDYSARSALTSSNDVVVVVVVVLIIVCVPYKDVACD